MLKIVPITLKRANAFVEKYHRHHKRVVGWKYGIGVEKDNVLCGVCIVGRPVNRNLDNGHTLEVTRLCTDGTPNACSILYSAAWRVAKNLGYERIVTYILENESGKSLIAAGWRFSHVTRGKTWNTTKRKRVDKHPLCDKKMFERTIL